MIDLVSSPRRAQNMRSSVLGLGVGFGLCILLLPPCSALAAPGAPHPCASKTAPAQRLACYDRAFPPQANAAEATVHSAERAVVDEFGLSRAQIREADPERAGPTAITARITSISALGKGRRVLSLDNGQTWVLTEATARGRLANGDPVTIRSAALGSFMLLTEAGVALRVRRLR